jgi:F-type H+-transporting ATPase subunit delta
MAKNDKVATRYAKAIFDYLGGDKKSVERVAAELTDFGECIEKSRELELALCEDLLTAEQRRWIIEDLAKRLEFSKESLRSLLVVAQQKRIRQIKVIGERLLNLLQQTSKVISIRVEAAVELSDDEKQRIEKKFKTILGKDVEANYQSDPRLIAGLRVTAAGKTYDGSVTGWLNTIEEQLVGGNI